MARALSAKIGPSILNSDLANLAKECNRLLDCNADFLHLDVMDGHFVPNITFGHPVVKCLRKQIHGAFFDMHMMVSNPFQWVEDMADAGANQYTFHVEAVDEPSKVIRKIKLIHLTGTNNMISYHTGIFLKRHIARREICGMFALIAKNEFCGVVFISNVFRRYAIKECGMSAGIGIKPNTPVDVLLPFIDSVDMVLVMTVEPGFGGQKFMENMMEKVRFLRERFPLLDIEVDGGVGPSNINVCATAGANMIVSGTAVIASPNPKEAISIMRETVEEAMRRRNETSHANGHCCE